MTIFCVILLLLSGSLHAESNLTQQAQHAWQCRDQAGQTEKAIQLWQDAIKTEPRRGDLWIWLAKAMGRAVRHANTPDERRSWADQARDAAAKAVELNPKDAEAYTVYGEALGQWADAHKGWSSLKAVRQAIAALQTAITINPKQAYAHMLLAEFYRQSPSFFFIGDKKKALLHAQKAVEYGPEMAINHLALARAYLGLGRRAEGITEFQMILTLSCPPDSLPEALADQETARAMLVSLGVPLAMPGGTSQSCSDSAGACTEALP